jgi:hypothetical protein
VAHAPVLYTSDVALVAETADDDLQSKLDALEEFQLETQDGPAGQGV